MRARVKEKIRHLFPTFRRVGIEFNHDWREVDPLTMTPAQLDFLRSADSAQFLEVEGGEDAESGEKANVGRGRVATPEEALAAAQKADVSLPEPPEPPPPPRRGR